MVGFEVLFESGRRFAEGVVQPRPAGMVTVPSGRLVVGDPKNGGHAPLVRRVPPGRYPATVSVVQRGASERRVAAAMLRFRAGPVVLWEPAVPEGKDPDEAPSPEAYFGFGVGSGLACFADSSAPLPHDVTPSRDHAGTELSVGDGTISVFSADGGTYASFWGLDGSGTPMVLVTDFRLVGTNETRGAEMMASAWPGASLDEEITRNWEASDIVSVPTSDVAQPVTVMETGEGEGERETGEGRNRKQETGNRKQETGNGEREKPGTGNREPGTGNGKAKRENGKKAKGTAIAKATATATAKAKPKATAKSKLTAKTKPTAKTKATAKSKLAAKAKPTAKTKATAKVTATPAARKPASSATKRR